MATVEATECNVLGGDRRVVLRGTGWNVVPEPR
jgi:hypothetical protein